MFKFLSSVFLIMLFTVGSANASSISDCEGAAKIGRIIMDARQSGTPVREVMSVMSISEMEGPAREVMTSVILLAYEEPIYSTEKYKQQAITEFENGIYVGCLRASQ
jgi:hypothetical protein